MSQIQNFSLELLTIRRATLDQIIALRHAELRENLPLRTAQFDGDEAQTTWHFGAFLDGVNIGCASFMLNSYEGAAAYQLRGMATRRGLTGRGIGQRLLQHAVQAILSETDVRVMWCNARVPAVPFYEKQGWQVVSDIFEIPTAGPHRRMTRG